MNISRKITSYQVSNDSVTLFYKTGFTVIKVKDHYKGKVSLLGIDLPLGVPNLTGRLLDNISIANLVTNTNTAVESTSRVTLHMDVDIKIIFKMSGANAEDDLVTIEHHPNGG